MTNVINFSDHKKTSKKINISSKEDLTINEIKKLENLRDGIEQLLNTATAVHGEPLGVSLAAGRYAAMKLYQMHGRAEAMAFFDSCIQTVEIAEDISVK